MSERFPGGYLTSTPPTPTSSVTPGVWTLDQALQNVKGGTWPPNGPFYIEELFSTYLYTGTGAAQTITNGINLSGKGGMVWIKRRDGVGSNWLQNTVSGIGNELSSNSTAATGAQNFVTSVSSTGFTVDPILSASANTYASWTFRKQPKFFDIVTYTGNDVAGRTISHSLGSVPGCIIVKRTDAGGSWAVYHRGLTSAAYGIYLNITNPEAVSTFLWNSTAPTSAVFSVGGGGDVNSSGGTYVAYIFAHDAGGFGLSGADNVVSCGSYVGNGSATGPVINLGYEPQWLMTKNITTDLTQNWLITDNMRGFFNGATNDPQLFANLSNAEGGANRLNPTATGFNVVSANSEVNASGETYIYIAIRRGPMKTPTDGTKVFEPVAYTGTGTNNRIITSSITPDSVIPSYRNTTGAKYWYDRLRGNGTYLIISGTNAEGTDGAVNGPQFNKVQTGYQQGTGDSGFINNSSYTYINWLFKRAPGFFDTVCYTGTGANQTVAHNLGVVPELMIVKKRSGATGGSVYSATIGNTQQLELFSGAGNSAAFVDTTQWNSTTPESTVFTLGTNGGVNGSGATYVAYLFASAPGVSKVGSYTGTGTTLQVNCGFTAGARFVLIKRTDSTGDWYVWDSARGIVAGNDPYLLMNSTAAEVTSTDYVDTFASGFEISSTAPAEINANGGTFIFLAIA